MARQTRELAVKFGTEGFAGAISQLRGTGKAFNDTLQAAKRAAQEASTAFKRSADGTDEQAKAARKLESEVKRANRAIQASYKELGFKSSADLNALKRQAVSAFEAIKASGTASARDIAEAQRQLKRRLGELDDQLDTTGRGFTNLGKVGVAALAGLVASLGFFGREVVTAGANLESFMVSLEVMLGSADRAQRLAEQLINFASTTPFELTEIQAATKSLLAFGFEAEEVEGVLRRVGDVSSGVNQPINEIAVIFGKARVQGRLFAEDINQLTERGIPIIAELADQFGRGQEEIRKLVEAGEVNFSNLEQAFISLTSEGGRFFELMDRQSETTGGRLSNLSDQFNQLKTAIFEVIEPEFNLFLEKAIQAVGFLTENVELVIAALAGLTSAGGILAAIQGVTALTGAIAGAGGLGAALAAIVAVLTGPVGIAIAVGAVVAGLVALAMRFEGVRKAGSFLLLFFQNLVSEAIRPVRASIDLLKQAFEGLRTIVASDGGVVGALKMLLQYFTPAGLLITGIMRLGNAIREYLTNNLDQVSRRLRQMLDILAAMPGPFSMFARAARSTLDQMQLRETGARLPGAMTMGSVGENPLPVPAAPPASGSSGSLPPPPGSMGGPTGAEGSATPQMTARAQALVETAKALGLTPQEWAAIVAQESSFNPQSIGGDGGNYQGLIQWGPSERANELPGILASLGIDPGTPITQVGFEDQLRAAVLWMRGRGFRSGMGQQAAYATILGGNPFAMGRDSNGTSAANNPAIQPGGRFWEDAATWLSSQSATGDLGTAFDSALGLQDQRFESEELRRTQALEAEKALISNRYEQQRANTRMQYEDQIFALQLRRVSATEQERQILDEQIRALQQSLSVSEGIANLDEQILLLRAEQAATGKDTTAEQAVLTAELEQTRIEGERSLILLEAESQQRVRQIELERKLRNEELNATIEQLSAEQTLQELRAAGDEQAVQAFEIEQRYQERRLQLEQLIQQARADGNQQAVEDLATLLARIEVSRDSALEAVRLQSDELRSILDQIKGSAEQALGTFFEDIFTGVETFQEAFQNFVKAVLQSLAQLAAQRLAQSIIGSIFGGALGGVSGGIQSSLGGSIQSVPAQIPVFASSGGLVIGPGTGTSDSISARLSTGEFVMRAKAVEHWGADVMASLNNLNTPNLGRATGGRGGSGVTQIINMSVQTPDANSFRRSESQIGRDAAEQLRRNQIRNG